MKTWSSALCSMVGLPCAPWNRMAVQEVEPGGLQEAILEEVRPVKATADMPAIPEVSFPTPIPGHCGLGAGGGVLCKGQSAALPTPPMCQDSAHRSAGLADAGTNPPKSS